MTQPNDFALMARIQPLIDQHRETAGGLLPLLHAIQDALGYIPDLAYIPIAKALNLSRAEVYGVVTYYHHFRHAPPAPHQIQICCAEACQARGSQELLTHLAAKLGCTLDTHPTTQGIQLEPIYCLGQCAVGPAVLVDNRTLYARVDPPALDTLMNTLQSTS